MSSTLTIILTTLFIGTIGAGTGISPSRAHSFYAPKCCSDMDCHPIDSCSELSENNDGSYSYGKLTFSKDKVHPSEDNKCHVCIGKYGAFGTIPVDTPICVYTQQGS